MKKRKDARLRVTFKNDSQDEVVDDDIVENENRQTNKSVEISADPSVCYCIFVDEKRICFQTNDIVNNQPNEQQHLKLRDSGDVRDFLQGCSPSTFDRIVRISNEMQKENCTASETVRDNKEDVNNRLSIIRESIESPLQSDAIVSKKPQRRRSAFNNINDETLYIPAVFVPVPSTPSVAMFDEDRSVDDIRRIPMRTPVFLRSAARAAAQPTPPCDATPKDETTTTTSMTNSSNATAVNSTAIDDKKVHDRYPPLELSPIRAVPSPPTAVCKGRKRRSGFAMNRSIIADTLLEDQEVRLINERPAASKPTRRSKRNRPDNPVSSLLAHNDETVSSVYHLCIPHVFFSDVCTDQIEMDDV